MYSLESHNRGDSNECIQHAFILYKIEEIPKSFPFAFWPCAVINPHWLELRMSLTNFDGPKGFRTIEVRLYIKDGTVLFKVNFQRRQLYHNFVFLLKRSLL